MPNHLLTQVSYPALRRAGAALRESLGAIPPDSTALSTYSEETAAVAVIESLAAEPELQPAASPDVSDIVGGVLPRHQLEATFAAVANPHLCSCGAWIPSHSGHLAEKISEAITEAGYAHAATLLQSEADLLRNIAVGPYSAHSGYSRDDWGNDAEDIDRWYATHLEARSALQKRSPVGV